MQWIDGGNVTSVPGFRAAGVVCGLKTTGALDLALVTSQAPCAAAGVFTTNRVKAAPVVYDQQVLARNPGAIRAVVANSGCANACTGRQGQYAAADMARLVADRLGCGPESVLVMSTGVIGQPLDMAKVAAGVPAAVDRLSADGGPDAARAIMTTDTRPKTAALRLPLGGRTVTVAGMAKGAGMIHPNLATMLCLITTDAAVTPPALDAALRRAVEQSFHRITVDGDTSTNDTVLLLANGLAGNQPPLETTGPDFDAFCQALTAVAVDLARQIVRDGEGATRFVTVQVRGAASDADAWQAAMAVARSNLVKTALFGMDPNWGRVLAAVGYSAARTVDPDRLALWFGDLALVRDGQPLPADETRTRAILEQPEVVITVDLGLGDGAATVWTCDLSYDYVRINAAYRT
jgi:glutamate N-acetyltransferase/amino-acid N-acetyltransferase